MKILLIQPPMSQMNSPYPATAYLKGFLQSEGHSVDHRDLGLELFLKIFSFDGLTQIHSQISGKKQTSDSVLFFLDAFEDYRRCIEPVVQFLQGKNPSLALRLGERKLVPEGPRFLPLREHEQTLLSQFGSLGIQDKAKYVASLYLDDLSDVIRQSIDPDFEFSRYAEKLTESQNSFEPLYKKLGGKAGLIDRWCEELFLRAIEDSSPDLVGMSVAFPGNLYAALRMAQALKNKKIKIPIVMGGGFVNTELRELAEPRFFEFVDYLLFDDGEKPLQLLLKYLTKEIPLSQLIRCKVMESGQVKNLNFEDTSNLAFKNHPGPDFSGLRFSDYVSMLEMPNAVHRMWSDFRWNKMILAHGCYWKRCSFCDVNLDYISRYEPLAAVKVVDQMQKIIKDTGTTGFHFVDEAAPPALLKSVSEEILRRGLVTTWWGNLRFDKQFTPELCELMADAGCVAVTGGLEVASPRVLKLINKGITIEQVAKVTQNFSKAGILVHAYLMYGFPTQTLQETVDSLEVVRQLFANDCLHSAHWHRFLTTAHSPVGHNPQEFAVKIRNDLKSKTPMFAQYDLPYDEEKSIDHDALGVGLRKALYNYMHQVGLEEPVHHWFEADLPRTSLKPQYIRESLR